MMPRPYAHSGQHANCERCGTYACDYCRRHVHQGCVGEPCQCEWCAGERAP